MAKKEIKSQNTGLKKNSVWTTKRVDSWMKDYAEGVIHKDNPWLDGAIGVRNPNIVFEYTPQEIEELTKCAGDILYFANKYCYCLHGTRGYQPLTLRDYQENMLKSYDENRFSVCCASRQIGKCSIFSYINILDNGEKKEIPIEEFYIENKNTILSNIKKWLYKIYKKI